MSDWERGRISPRPHVIPRLAAAIGLDALEFVAANAASPTLEDMRLAAGMTMREVADAVGVSLRRYHAIELGATRRDPPDELVTALATTFAVTEVMIRSAVEAARPA